LQMARELFARAKTLRKIGNHPKCHGCWNTLNTGNNFTWFRIYQRLTLQQEVKGFGPF